MRVFVDGPTRGSVSRTHRLCGPNRGVYAAQRNCRPLRETFIVVENRDSGEIISSYADACGNKLHKGRIIVLRGNDVKFKLEMTSQCFLRKTKTNVPLGREGGVKARWCPGDSHPHQLWVFCLGRSNTGRVLGMREESKIKTSPQHSGDAATEPV